jgi:hypothetical protein
LTFGSSSAGFSPSASVTLTESFLGMLNGFIERIDRDHTFFSF